MLNTIKTETSKFQPSYGVPRRSVLDPPTPKPRSQSTRMFSTSAARAKLHPREQRQTRRRRRITHPVCRCALFLATPGPSRRPRRPRGSACSRQLAKSKNDSRQPATSRTRDNFATTPTRDSPRHLAGEARRCCSAVCTLSSERSRFLSIGVPTCISVPETLPARSS